MKRGEEGLKRGENLVWEVSEWWEEVLEKVVGVVVFLIVFLEIGKDVIKDWMSW